jgi:hypothetical protein
MTGNVIRELLQQKADLLVLGDFHVGEFVKSSLLYELLFAVSRKHPHAPCFHASEYFFPEDRPQIDEYLDARPEQMSKLWHKFPRNLIPFLSTITMAAYFPGQRRCAILPAGSHVRGDQPGGPEARHKALFETFQDSARHHNSRSRATITSKTARGNFLMGAFHAARSQPGSAAKTTTRLLVEAGWSVHVARVVVYIPQVFPLDSLLLEPRSQSGKAIDLGPILKDLSGNKDCYIPLNRPGSPFSDLRAKGPPDAAYSDLFDAFVFLGSS